MPDYPDDLIKSILRSVKVIAMVGASGNEMRPSYFAMKYLLDKGYIIHPVNPGMAGKEILGPHGLCLAQGRARPRRHGRYLPRRPSTRRASSTKRSPRRTASASR